KRYSWDFDSNYDLFEVDLAGNMLKRLTNSVGYDAEAAWSPDGRSIVFASNRHAYSGAVESEYAARFSRDPSILMDIYIMDSSGGSVRRLTTEPGYDGGPFFSADGKQIIWRRFGLSGDRSEIFVMNSDGSNKRQVTNLGAMSWAPYFHPSGDYFIFATNIHGYENFELYMARTDGRYEPVRVTSFDGFDGLPVFSPDGSTLSWTSKRSSNTTSQIFLASWNDREARKALRLYTPRLSQMSGRDVAAEQTESEQSLYRDVEYLSSDNLEGRLTGTRGEELATEFAAKRLEELGFQPAGDNGTFFQRFSYTAGISLGERNALLLSRRNGEEQLSVQPDVDFRPLAFSATGTFSSAPVVFAGYGIRAPEEGEFGEYDSYVHLDVKDKWVMILRYVPENISPKWRQHLSRYSSLRYKVMIARDLGAKGLLIVSGPASKVKEDL
ncbi:MAG: PD40 domain-containing protein, partial [Bdellovibrionales bacterium]|nr:PD40 domain-containing protein [Bdellovibrionales bacterium]